MITNNTHVSSIGPIGLMWVVLVTLKLMAIVDWTWWIVVFFPVIAWLGIGAISFILLIITGGLVWACTSE